MTASDWMTDSTLMAESAVMRISEQPFADLSPDRIIAAVESLGRLCDGRLLALNSYENRVWQVGQNEGPPLIVKFYRNARWSDAQILEEHALVEEFAAHELPVVAPMRVAGETLHTHGGYRFALFPRQGGRAPDLEQAHHLRAIGRVLGRMHRIGSASTFSVRPALDIEQFGRVPAAFVQAECLPAHLQAAYAPLVEQLLTHVEARFAEIAPHRIRAHADFHPGNILWRDDAPHLVDFDDARMAPAVQDIWMMVTGSEDEQRRALSWLLEGYTEFNDFDRRELHLVEPLRVLRMLHHSAWLAHRAAEPAFLQAFPWFGSTAYWEGHILDLKEQLGHVSEPSIFFDSIV